MSYPLFASISLPEAQSHPNPYISPRVYRLKAEDQVSKNKAIINIFGMSVSPSLSVTPTTAEKRGTCVKKNDSVAELVSTTEHLKCNNWRPDPYTKVHKEG